MAQVQRMRITDELMAHQLARALGCEINEGALARRRRLKRMNGFPKPRNRALDLLIWGLIVAAIWAAILIMSFLWLTGAVAEGTPPAPQDLRTVSVHQGSTLTVRAQPSTAAHQLGALARGCKVAVGRLRDNWALVYWPNHLDWPPIGWVCTDYLQ